ncbi:MAG: hypothetical protein K2G93_02255 [Rikenella sp.]|nr:hypothetical protein [Rikenella sp.]
MFYPAPGYRRYSSGTLYAVGVSGFSWSSSASGSLGYYLDFNYGGINPNHLSYRANGFQLRCLQE